MKRKLITALLIAVFAAFAVFSAFSASSVSDDPADTYKVQTAPDEDSTISMWFDYSFRKTFTSDKTSTGMNTFSIYMAKNEIEDAQFVLYSDTDRDGMSADITPFTDGEGNTVDAALYYEMYVTISNLDKTSVYKSTEDTTFIREGEVPDPVAPIEKIGTFKLNGGKSQAFLIRAKTTTDSKSGWYSAQLNVYDAEKNTVKTATVYLYVWDFVLSEKTALESSVFIADNVDYGGSYKDFYDYLLENRICGMDLPTGVVSSTSSYITKDRVVSVRISSTPHPQYLDRTNPSAYENIYNDLASSPIWDEVRGKLYQYPADEPLPKSIVANYRDTIDTLKEYTDRGEYYWGDSIRTLTTFTENHVYPYGYFMQPLDTVPKGELEDSVEAVFEYDKIDIFCPIIGEFTPYEEVMSLPNRNGITTPGIRLSSSYPYSGAYGGVGSGKYAFFDWDKFYGASTVDRYRSYIAKKNSENTDGLEKELWVYNAGQSHSYTYCNHMIENTGLQTKLLFWQCFKEDVTGYLYYATNGWTSSGLNMQYDSTVTGAKTTCRWYTNPYNNTGSHNAYGDGVLFYGMSMGKVKGVPLIGSLRVEIMRDGIEEYQMMSQLEELSGEKAAKEYVRSVSNSMIDYISMPAYDRSAWDSDMDEYDIVESARRSLGFALEAATQSSYCSHEWDEGCITSAPTCQHTGEKTYICTLCGAEKTECLPSVHTENTTYEKISGNSATCTEDGKEIYRCRLCGFEKTVRTPAYHTGGAKITYEYKSGTGHSKICNFCNTEIAVEGHRMFAKRENPTCTEDGKLVKECKQCKYETVEEILPATGHTYENGVCISCGEVDPSTLYTLGDLNADGEVTAIDSNLLKKYLAGSLVLSDTALLSAEVSGDGEITAIDANLMTKYVAGTLTSFDK